MHPRSKAFPNALSSHWWQQLSPHTLATSNCSCCNCNPVRHLLLPKFLLPSFLVIPFEATNDRLWNLGALTRHPPSSSIPQTLREPPPCWTKGPQRLGMEALPTKYHGMLPVEATNQKNKLKIVKKKRYCIYLEFDVWEVNPHVSGPATETTISDQQRPSSDPGWCTRASEWGKGTRTAVAVCPESVAKKSKGWWKDVELQR